MIAWSNGRRINRPPCMTGGCQLSYLVLHALVIIMSSNMHREGRTRAPMNVDDS